MDKNPTTNQNIRIVENWGRVKNSVLLADVVDFMIENGIITPDQWMDIKHRPISDPQKMEEFLYLLQKQEPEALICFVKALRKAGYNSVADHLDGGLNTTDNERANSEYQENLRKYQSTWRSETLDTVRLQDLDKMKEEMKNDFIKISQNVVSEIKRDMMVLHRDSKDLKNGFEKLRRQEHEVSEQMDKLVKSVEGLRNNLERSEREYQELKRLNYKLKDDLTKLSKTMSIKEKENEELENKLQKKTEEYKVLQRTMKSLKSGHEERLERLKAIHKEKIRLKDEYEKALVVKEEAEAKFQTINQETKEAEIKHINEVSELQSEIEIKVSRIEDLERDKNELAKQLCLMEKNIEKLKTENKQLKDDLAKIEQEKGMSNTLQKVHSLPSFCPHNPPHRRAPPTFKRGTKANKW